MTEQIGLYIPPDASEARMTTGHYVLKETIYKDHIFCESPWLEQFTIGGRRPEERLFFDFYNTPAAMRAGGVSQLSKTRALGTIPNLASFTRRIGLQEQHGLIDIMAQDLGLTEEEYIAYHVAAEGDDLAHVIMSHGVEQGVQGWGGPENWHHAIWPLVAELGGVVDVLKNAELKINKKIMVKGIAIPPWLKAESDSKDIDMDNYQYVASEALLWFDHDGADPRVRQRVREAVDPKNVEITPDGRLAFKDEKQALVFSKLLLLFTTEHYNDGLNRCQLHQINQGVQRSVVRRRVDWIDEIDQGEPRKPSDYLLMIDDDLVRAMHTGPGRPDDFMYAIRNSLYRTGSEERERFIDYKLPLYTEFILDDNAQSYPSEHLTPKRVNFGPTPSSVEVTVRPYTEEDRKRQGGRKLPVLNPDFDGIEYVTPPFKDRSINPLVRFKGGYARLTEVNPKYRKLLREQQILQQQAVVVRLVFTDEYTEHFKEGVRVNQEEFERAKKQDGLTDDQKRRIIEKGARRSVELAQAAGTLVIKNDEVAERFQ